jgi:transcription-repair coupling factor (superfamily II helicase)
LLGEEQSGTVKEVGIELYQAMLREAIQNLQYSELERERKGMNSEFSPVINLDFSVLIPEFYIPDLSLRMSFYRKIANLKDDAEVDNILYELSDRFGSAPIEVKNLMEVVKLKNLAIHANVEKIEQGSKAIVLKFYQNKSKNAEKLLKFIMANPKRYQLKPDNKLLYKIDEVIVNNAYKGGIPANENNKNNISSNDYIFKEIRKVLSEVIACS